MKKITYLLITFALAIFVFGNKVQAQKKYVNKAAMWAEGGERLDSALKMIVAAESDEKTKDWPKTYFVKGEIYEAIANSQNPDFQSISEHPLVDAFDNYQKAYKMEGSKSYQNSIDIKLLTLVNAIINKAVNAYQNEDYKDAYLYFEKSLEVKNMPVFAGEIDTAIIFNTGITAERIGDYDNAIKYYKKTIEYSYGKGDTYSLLAEAYKLKGDNENYVQTLKDGFEKYPDNQSLLGGIINYYLLESENADEAFKYLQVAREADPNNPQFYSAEAHLYDKMGDKEKAKEKYLKSIELDSNFFEAYYNLGVLYFNEGVELIDAANKITDNKKYEAAKKIADEKFMQSLPYIEKAHQLKPEDQSILATLKTLYYRLKQNNPEMNDKYNAILEEMK